MTARAAASRQARSKRPDSDGAKRRPNHAAMAQWAEWCPGRPAARPGRGDSTPLGASRSVVIYAASDHAVVRVLSCDVAALSDSLLSTARRAVRAQCAKALRHWAGAVWRLGGRAIPPPRREG